MTAGNTPPASRLRSSLGYAGLIPFAGCLALIVAGNDPALRTLATFALLSYAAIIVSFLGAVHWGPTLCQSALQVPARLIWGVTPAIVAWLLLLLPTADALLGMALLFALALLIDGWLLPLPDPNYRRLRIPLSLAAIATPMIAFFVEPSFQG